MTILDSSLVQAEAATAAAGLEGFEGQALGESMPARMGHYRIERRLGVGGMGEVYLAHDELLDRKIAIKRVLASLSSEREQARLRSEARALAKLSHPNVVQVYEIGEHQQRTFLAMEYVDGQTLAGWLREQPRRWPDVLDCFLAAGQGLAAAHRAEVTHRDFKPDNVLLGRDGCVRVADFGIAIAGERRTASEPGSTETGAIVGTIRYMPLEQLLGEHVDARTDQFAFCVALYEALWNQLPFPLGSLEQRLDALEAGEPTPPPLGSWVPRGLWRIVRRGLARSPAERWPDLTRLLVALAGLPRRRRRWIAAAVATPVLGLAFVAQALIEQREVAATTAACEAEGRSIDEVWNDEVRADLERAFLATGREFAPTTWALTRARMDEFADTWAGLRTQTCVETWIDHTRSEASRDEVVECLDEARATFATLAATWTVADDAIVASATMAVAGLPSLTTCVDGSWSIGKVATRPGIRSEVARLRARLDRVKALKLAVQYDQGLAEAREVFVEAEALGWLPLIAEAGLAVGDMQDRVGHYTDARATLHRAFLDATRSGHDFIALRASIALTTVAGARLRHTAEALEWGGLAQALLERLDLNGSMHEASALYALGRAQRAQGDLRAALATHRRVRSLDEAVHGPDHPDVALSLQSIGTILIELGDVDDARIAYQQALAIQQRSLGPEHPDIAGSLIGLAEVAEASGDVDGAIEGVRAALRIEEAALGPDHEVVAETLDLLSAMSIRAGRARPGEQPARLPRR